MFFFVVHGYEIIINVWYFVRCVRRDEEEKERKESKKDIKTTAKNCDAYNHFIICLENESNNFALHKNRMS